MLVSLLRRVTITFKVEPYMQYAKLWMRADWLHREKRKQIICKHRPGNCSTKCSENMYAYSVCPWLINIIARVAHSKDATEDISI